MKIRVGLQVKAAIVISLLVVFVSTALTWVFIENEKKMADLNMRRQSKALSDNLAYNCEYGLLTGNTRILQDILNGIIQQPDVLYSYVADREGRVVARTDHVMAEGDDLLLEEQEKHIQGLVTIIRASLGDKQVYKASRPVISAQKPAPRDEAGILLVEEEWGWTGDVKTPGAAPGPFRDTRTTQREKIGTVTTIFSLEEMFATIRKAQRVALRMAGTFLFFTVAVVVLITKWAVAPINSLVLATRKISAGDLDVKVSMKARDEIGELAEAFNKMSENLKQSMVSIEVLEDARKRFEDVAQNTGDWIWEVDRQGKYVYSSSGGEIVLGYRREEILGKSFSDFLAPEEKEETAEGLYGIFREKQAFREYEVHILRKDGKIVTLEMTGIPVLDNDGNFVGYRGVGRDITERKKVELSQRLAKLGSMVSDMAHEVNNPLQIVSGRAQLAMMEEPANPEVMHALRIIQDQCARAKDIIQRMLKFSRPSKGIFEPGDINSSIDFVVHLLEHQFSLVNIKIEKKYDLSIAPVNMDEKQMHEVFMNILKNGADAMPGGGKLTIKTVQRDKNIRVEIKDTGEGIKEENLKKILEPFFTTKDQGTGLGLSVCYGIIKEHGGDLLFASKETKGTTVTVILPAYVEPRQALKGEN